MYACVSCLLFSLSVGWGLRGFNAQLRGAGGGGKASAAHLVAAKLVRLADEDGEGSLHETAAASIAGSVADRGDGTYSASYTCHRAGMFALSVCTWEGDAVRGSAIG